MTIRIRLLYYILLLAFCIIIPFIIAVTFILVTKADDEAGLVTLVPSSFLVQFVFGLLFIKKGFSKKLILDTILTLLSFGLFILLFKLKLFTTGVDAFGLFDLVLYNFLSGLIVWETYFQINKKYH